MMDDEVLREQIAYYSASAEADDEHRTGGMSGGADGEGERPRQP